MKKFLLALCGLLLGVPAFAADNIKMVTYFPVPYVSYGDLAVTGSCDVGLLNTCSLSTGSKLDISKVSGDSRPLNTGNLTVTAGTLALNSSNSSSTLRTSTLTAGSGTSTGVLEFAHDLSVRDISGNAANIVEATNRANLSSLYLFGSDRRFPACDASGNVISWKKLTVNGKEGVFLVCGSGDKSKTPCPTTCSAGYKRDPNVQYEEDGECCVARPLCSATCPEGYVRDEDVTYEDESSPCCKEKPKEVYYFVCSGHADGTPPIQPYSSYAAAKEACESGRNTSAYYIATIQESTHATGRYAQCNTEENRNYLEEQIRYSYQTLQNTLYPDLNQGSGFEPIPVSKPMRYSCTTQCVTCGGGIGGFNPCTCTWGEG